MSELDDDEARRRKAEVIAAELGALPVSERASVLEERCSGDAELRAIVSAWLADGPESQTLERGSGDPDMRPVAGPLSRLGPYRILRPIGSGGMGVVYEAEDTRLGRKVAVKLLPESKTVNERSRKRFLQEARVASSLDHPNICSIYDVGEGDDGQWFIVMAYYDGETLEERLRRGPLTIQEARDTAIRIARGLERAHAAGITHRDVKPANVILTKGQEVKLLDFGLAKLAGAASLTRTGGVPGTPAYMSPEQVRGMRDIDGRADIFALGSVLYEMLTGRRPFSGDSPAEVIAAIAQAPSEPVTQVRKDVPESVARIVERALAKDRDQRYQNVTEILADLEADTAPVPAPRIRRRRTTRVAASLAIAVMTVLAWILSGPSHRDAEPDADIVPASSEARQRPSIAVLRFQNLTGAPEIAWLQGGLAEMLVTELSQSPQIAVASTARIYESLKENELLDESAPSFDQIRQLAKDVDASSVIRGSYARVGGVFRIAVTIEDVASGEILVSDRVEGEGEESVFALVDQIAAVIRNRYEITRPVETPPTVAAATTSSFEAWRLYSEGIELANEFKDSEAIALLERAVEIDPSFALALAALGNTHSGLGHEDLAELYSSRALALADRLPVDQRYRVEGVYYGAHWSTLERAIEIYEKGLRSYPDKVEWRNNLARRYAFLERYQDAIREFDTLIQDGSDFVGDRIDVAIAHAALGQMEEGYRLLSDLSGRDEWFAQYVLGWYATEWGRRDEAVTRFENASRLRPGEWTIPYAQWRISVLSENWDEADARARQFLRSSEPQARWRAAVSLARNALYSGSARRALEWFDAAATSYASPNAYTALARSWKAEVLLELSRPIEALRETAIARESGAEEFPELKAMVLAALAHDEMGQGGEADALFRELEKRWEEHGRNKVEERQLQFLKGRLALQRDEQDSGVEALRRAAVLLPPRGVEFHWHVYPDHVAVWVALGEAELAAGRIERARDAFERAAKSGSEHLEQPVPFVRSFYFLGRLALERGETDHAQNYFLQFLSHWQNGEIDRERVFEARAATGG